MKIAINACFGVFNLSAKAISRIAEMNGQKAYFFNTASSGKDRHLIPVPIEEAGLFTIAYNTPTPSYPDVDSEEILSHRYDCRHDDKLIKAIEELGSEANGPCSKIKIVEIPDGVEYEIEEYDGMESIQEKHRSWR